jgi:hypothetical protein
VRQWAEQFTRGRSAEPLAEVALSEITRLSHIERFDVDALYGVL